MQACAWVVPQMHHHHVAKGDFAVGSKWWRVCLPAQRGEIYRSRCPRVNAETALVARRFTFNGTNLQTETYEVGRSCRNPNMYETKLDGDRRNFELETIKR